MSDGGHSRFSLSTQLVRSRRLWAGVACLAALAVFGLITLGARFANAANETTRSITHNAVYTGNRTFFAPPGLRSNAILGIPSIAAMTIPEDNNTPTETETATPTDTPTPTATETATPT